MIDFSYKKWFYRSVCLPRSLNKPNYREKKGKWALNATSLANKLSAPKLLTPLDPGGHEVVPPHLLTPSLENPALIRPQYSPVNSHCLRVNK